MSIQKKMFGGMAIVIMLILGLWVVGCLYAFITALMSNEVILAAVQFALLLVGLAVLGWYVTSTWYKAKT